MALTQVFKWTDKDGYLPVTTEEAAMEYPYTVSARSKLFICGICGQGVTFTAGQIVTRHFRHDQAAQNKECEERSRSYGSSPSTSFTPQKIHTLPLRLVRQATPWQLELGLLALQDNVLSRCIHQTLCIETDERKKYTYNLQDRLHPNKLAWLYAGDQPATYFQLSLSNGSLPPLWPQRVDGLNDVTLFDVKTGQRLPFFPDIEVGKEYYVFIRGSFNLKDFCSDVRVEYIRESIHGWHDCKIYKMKALRFGRESASFFIQFGAHLRQRASLIFPLWPAVLRTPHLIYHNAEKIFVFLYGDNVQFKSFPAGALTYIIKQEKAYLALFSCGMRKQVVSGDFSTPILHIGRFSQTLRYDYFIRQSFTQTAPLPIVTVKDAKGNELKEDAIEDVRPRTLLQVQGPFDGEVWVRSSSSPLTEKWTLRGGQPLNLKVRSGQKLTIFQGLDCVRTITLGHPEQEKQTSSGLSTAQADRLVGWTDTQLCRHLRRMSGDEIEAPRVLAQALHFFKGWRSVERWLRQKQGKGHLPRRALMFLTTLTKLPTR